MDDFYFTEDGAVPREIKSAYRLKVELDQYIDPPAEELRQYLSQMERQARFAKESGISYYDRYWYGSREGCAYGLSPPVQMRRISRSTP